MGSTFHGLEVSRRSLFAQQSALNTTGHNISNANTEGYTRQRAEMRATRPIPAPGATTDRSPGQVGTGVEVVELKRIREEFLDLQFRGENKHLGYWDSKLDSLQKIETVLNEPSESGLQATMDKMWEAWQDLQNNPSSVSAREVVRQRAVAVEETFANINRRFEELQNDLNTVIKVKTSEVNSITNQIRDLNDQIGRIVPHGYQPNDLFDQRDLLLDKLSSLVDITTTPTKNGMIKVSIEGQTVVDGLTASKIEAVYNTTTGLYDVTRDSQPMNLSSGSLFGYLEARGSINPETGKMEGIIPSYMERMDVLAHALGKEINTVHRAGVNLDDITKGTAYESGERMPFFVDREWYEANKSLFTQENVDSGALDLAAIPDPKNAKNMMVNPLILQYANKIATALPNSDGSVYAGNGRNAEAIAGLKFKVLTDGLDNNSTLDDYYRFTIAKLGVDGQEAERLAKNSEVLVGQVDVRRQSVSSVSLDEEMTNMIKYQQAYNAAARNVTAVDEMLDKIINGMGRVGL